jgi:hypothetical protein
VTKEGPRVRERHTKPMREGLRDKGQRLAALEKIAGRDRGIKPRGGKRQGRHESRVLGNTSRGHGLTGCLNPCTGVGVMESSDEVARCVSAKIDACLEEDRWTGRGADHWVTNSGTATGEGKPSKVKTHECIQHETRLEGLRAEQDVKRLRKSEGVAKSGEAIPAGHRYQGKPRCWVAVAARGLTR